MPPERIDASHSFTLTDVITKGESNTYKDLGLMLRTILTGKVTLSEIGPSILHLWSAGGGAEGSMGWNCAIKDSGFLCTSCLKAARWEGKSCLSDSAWHDLRSGGVFGLGRGYVGTGADKERY